MYPNNRNNHWRSNEIPEPNDYPFYGKYLPSGHDGFTYMDLDGMIRWHGPNFNTDDIGYYMYQERKSNERWKNKTWKDIPVHQYAKYAIVDVQNSTGLLKERYVGLYLIWSDDHSLDTSNEFQINGIGVTKEDLINFYLARLFNRFPRYVFESIFAHDLYHNDRKFYL